ncbi:MAG: metal-sensitive transcriptional regulator [Legionellales bacterium]|nr:metal-sensitive transcriptional regulator [Legionellales bacterium]
MNKNISKQYPDHKKHISHINRIKGQIEGIANMIEEQRYCYDILIQLSAVRSSIRSIELKILDKHIACCVSDAFKKADSKNQQEKIMEICNLIRKLK